MKLIEILKYLLELAENGFGRGDEFSRGWDEFYTRKTEALLPEIKEALLFTKTEEFKKFMNNRENYEEMLEDEIAVKQNALETNPL